MIALTKVLLEQGVPAQQVLAPLVAEPGQRVVRKVIVPQTEYQQNLRQTFNTLPNKGRDLQIAGTGQKTPANPEHQAAFDAKFKQVAAANRNLNLAGVPGVAQVQPAAPQEMSGAEHAIAAVKKGAKAAGEAATNVGQMVASGAKVAGEAVGTGAKAAAEHVAEHPVGAALTAVAGGTIGAGIRRVMRGKSNK